jgi:cobalamin biosynthesis protein CbiG
LTSLALLASIDLKQDEPGLLAAAQELGRPLRFFTRQQLAAVPEIPTPSDSVARHIGVHSVCEASALLAAGSQRLLVPKRKGINTTIAIARRPCVSSG